MEGTVINPGAHPTLLVGDVVKAGVGVNGFGDALGGCKRLNAARVVILGAGGGHLLPSSVMCKGNCPSTGVPGGCSRHCAVMVVVVVVGDCAEELMSEPVLPLTFYIPAVCHL